MNEQVSIENVVADQPATFGGASVGEQLRKGREACGLQVGEIAQTLKLGARQVEALETGDWQGLPGQTFVRGFVRNYARVVQLDPAPLMAQLDQVLAKPTDNLAVQDMAPAAMPSTGGAGSRRDRLVVMVGAGLVALAVLASLVIPGDLSSWRENTQAMLDSFAQKESTAVTGTGESAAPAGGSSEPVFPPGESQQQVMFPQALTPAEAPAATTPVPPAATPTAVDAVPAQKAVAASANSPQLRFLLDKESWIEVRDRDNQIVFSQRLKAGTEQALSGQGPLSLTIGNAPGVRLFWHGQAIDLVPHTRGDVARLVLE
jgi:cytoskeleton protein RodZ